MGGVWSDSFQVSPSKLTGDAPPEQIEEPEPSPVASPLSNGYVAYPDGQKPAEFDGICTVAFEYTKGINNLKIIMDTVDSWDQVRQHNSSQLTFGSRDELIRNLNAHKGSFQDSFTVVTYEQFFYRFENFFNPVSIYMVPHLLLSNGLDLYNVFIVVEEPVATAAPAPPRRPLFARLWSKFIGDSAQPQEPAAETQGLFHVSILWYEEDQGHYLTRTTTVSDCHVIAKEIDVP